MPSSPPGVQFKFTHAPSGYTRRISFPTNPSWEVLASKVEALYGIPVGKVGVSYVDVDGDEVTLSTDEELQDFYHTTHQPGQLIKFQVLDLSSPRHRPGSPILPSAGGRAFGSHDDAFDLDEWQRVPSFPAVLPVGPHAFVEVLDSNASSLSMDDNNDTVKSIPRVQTDIGPYAFVEVLDSNASSISMDDSSQHHNNAGGNSGTVRSAPEGVQADVGPIAFVEVLDSNASSISMDDASQNDDGDNSTVKSVPKREQSTTSEGKGKGRAGVTSEFPSTASVLAADTSQKHPIHVYDVSTHEEQNNGKVPEPATFVDEGNPVVAESTPKSRVRGVETESRNNDSISEAFADPPLPTIPNASLSNDLATLLTSLSNAVASHPELSEGLRNIIRNVGNGTYWSSHRESISRAASDIANSAGEAAREARRQAEEEAGRRVTEALGGLFRSLSGAVPDVGNDNPDEEARPAGDSQPPFRHFYPFHHRGQHHHPFARGTWVHGWHNARNFPPPPPPRHAMPGASRPTGPPPPSHARPGPPPPPPPHAMPGPPPPPPPHGPPPPPPSHVMPGPPPPPPTGPVYPPPFMVPGSMAPPRPRGSGAFFHGRSPFIAPFERSHLADVSSSSFIPFQPSYDRHEDRHDEQANASSPEELRAQVEAAKKAYKATKEQYRQEREERRRQQESQGAQNGEPGPSTAPAARLARADVIGVRRHNTHPGHGAHHHHHNEERRTEDLISRALARIKRRLSDMGFTENGYPELGSKIKGRLSAYRTITRDDEDNIVTLVLEELLATTPMPPGGLRDESSV